MDVCTIIAKNYLAAARVLAASLHAQQPDARFHVLVVDDIDGDLDPSAEPFEILGPGDIGLPGFRVMAGIYDVLELSTAVKPWLLRTLLERDSEGVVYLDPDMRVYAPLDEAFEAVREHGLVLNPHNTEPMPRDGRKPNEQDILIAGAYNLGFVGLAANGFSDFLLDWWAERLESDCIVDPARGFFVDQRWMDLVPGLARDFHLIRDPGFNVAYWNLPTRRLSKVDGRVLVNDAPLRLFHFSGFKPDRPHLLSTYQDRIRLGDDPVLTELCADYTGALEAAGHATSVTWPYAYATTPGGIRLDRSARALYRRGIDDDRLDGTLFDAEGERGFVAYAHEPADRGGEHGVTRYLAELYSGRPDLRATYPDLSDAGMAAGFLGWVNVHGREEGDVPGELLLDWEPQVPSARVEAASGAEEPETPFGVNVAGYLHAELGVGEVARQVIAALDANAVPLLPVGLSAPNSRQDHEFATVGTMAAPFDVNIICVNADGLPAFIAEAGDRFVGDRYNIGIWWWELAEFPEQLHGSFAHLDEIWAGSSFVAEALSAVSPVPVVPMALPISAPPAALPERGRLGVPEGFVFLFSFDYNSVFRRKNPLGLLDAFTRAFAPGDGVSLIVKSINHEKDRESHERLRIAASAHPHVHVMDSYLPAADNHALIASCDAYVSLHRSEGFGLGLAEALLLGKPVIATGYGGNTDFVTGETGYVVPYELVDVGDGAWPYQPEARWADPDLDRAGALMREVVADPSAAAARAGRGAALLLERHSPYTAGARMVERLLVVTQRRRAMRSLGLDAAASASGVLAERIRATAAATRGRGRLGPVGGLGRKVLLRALKPYTAHGDAIDLELVQQLEGTNANLRTALRALGSAHAVMLADHRQLRNRLEAVELTGGSDAMVAAQIADLAGQADQLRLEQRVQRARLQQLGLLAVTPDGKHPEGADYSPAPEAEPWSEAYTEAHQAFVAAELGDPRLLTLFRTGEALPPRFGVGFDERVVEFPWLAAQKLSGDVLDAGSTLNHVHVLTALRPRMDNLHIVTLAPEEEALPQLGVSYLFADLRDLPIVDATYDRVLSLSTLEHVGLDTTYYGGQTDVVPEPQAELLRAVRELHRVLKPGGDLYVTIPVGLGERFEWVRSLTHEEIDEAVDAFGPSGTAIRYFAYDESGWHESTREATAAARYRDHFSSGPPGSDRAVAAYAVACLHLVKPMPR